MNAVRIATAYIKNGMVYGLAIHKASEETGVSTKEISNALLHRKEVKKQSSTFKKNYQSTVPAWVRNNDNY